ncbi:MAG: cold-shock protein [bacterium]
MIGRIKFYNEKKGFGFIETNSGDVFFHISSCKVEPSKNEKVIFDVKEGRKGKVAVKIFSIDDIEFTFKTFYDDVYYISKLNGERISSDSLDELCDEMTKKINKTVEFCGFKKNFMVCKIYVNGDFIREISVTVDDEDFVNKYFPEKMENINSYKEQMKKEEKRGKIERYEKKLSWLRMMVPTIWENLKIEFPASYETEVDSIYHRGDTIHRDVSKALNRFRHVYEDIYMDIHEIDNMAEDEHYVDGDDTEYKHNIHLRNAFNKVFEPYKVKCVVRDKEGNVIEKDMLERTFADIFFDFLVSILPGNPTLENISKEELLSEIESLNDVLEEEKENIFKWDI